MKKSHLQNVDLIKDRKTCDKNRNFFCSVGRKINLLIFVFLLIAMANATTRGQMADEFNPNVINQNTNSAVFVIQPQPDGKIIVGTVGVTLPAQTGNQLFRFNANGMPDASFNSNVNNGVYTAALQTDGKIIIGGFFSSVNGQARSILSRLNADGTLDASFTLTPDSTVNTSAQQPDGKILIGGIFSNISGVARSRLARLNADGTLDMSFNLAAVYDFGRGVQDIALQPDGKIIIGGYPSIDGSIKTVARLNADGTPDTAFNQNVFSFNEPFQNVRAVAVQSNGKILLGGSFISPQTSLIRLNADGTTDTAFNPRPTVQNSVISSVDVILVQPDQKILVGGFFTRIGGANRNSLARLFSDSRSVPATGFDFDGDGKADISAFRPSNGVWHIFQSASQFQSSGGLRSVAFGIASDRLAPADYDGDFITDIAVFREGAPAYFYILQSRTNTFRAEPFGTTGDVPVPGDYDGDNKTDYAVYRGGTWYLQRSQLGFTAMQFGTETDVPTPADYDGDGRTDIAVFRNGTWYLNRSTAGSIGGAYSAAGDKPIPSAFVQ